MDHDEMRKAMRRATEPQVVIHSDPDGRWVLWQADCRTILSRLPDNCVDAIVTDPPYGLEFMGKEWDSFKTGRGAKYARGGSMSEDVSIPGTGFTKLPQYVQRPAKRCAKCGKQAWSGSPCQCDEPQWSIDNSPLISFQRFCEEWAREALRVLKPGGHLLAFGGSRTYHRLACAVEDAGFEIRDQIMWVYGSGFPKSLDVSKAIDKAAGAEREVVGKKPYTNQDIRNNAYDSEEARNRPRLEALITAPATDAAKQWQGWGTALKPSHEPIVVARKPLEGTVAANVLKWGTGALNIDGTRVPSGDSENFVRPVNHTNLHEGWQRPWHTNPHALEREKKQREKSAEKAGELGRWPANFIHDGSDEVLALFPDTASGTGAIRKKAKGSFGLGGDGGANVEYGDSGSAARFFYCAKPGKKERNAGLNLCRCDKLSHTNKQEQSWENEGHQAPHPTGTDQSHGRDTGASTTPPNGDSEWNTFSSGNSTTAQSLQDAKSTTSTTTNSTTESETCNSSPQPNTSASTQGANSAMVNGGSRARSVAKSSASEQTTGTSVGKGGPSMGDADRATSPSSSNQSGGENLWCADCGGLRGGHATVKPIALMRYLIRLVTPPGGVVLDPFAGSGTTMVAALMEGAQPWGCEMTADYVPIILGRVGWALDEVDSRIEGTL